MLHQVLVGVKFRRRPLPRAPRSRGGETDLLVVARQAFMVRRHKIAAFVLRDLISVTFPEIRKDLGGPILIEPLQFLFACEENPPEDQPEASIRVADRVSQAQRAAPRTAENIPLIDAELFPQRLDVADQVLRSVLAKIGVRGRPARSPLV